MGTLIVAIIGLAIAQVLTLLKLAHSQGKKDQQLEEHGRRITALEGRPPQVIVERTERSGVHVAFDGETTLDRVQRMIDERERTSKIESTIAALRDEFVRKVSGWARAIARLGWRVENLERLAEAKLRSNPRMFAVRAEPEKVDEQDEQEGGTTVQDIPDAPPSPLPPLPPRRR